MKQNKVNSAVVNGVRIKTHVNEITHGKTEVTVEAGTNGLSRKKGWEHCPRAVVTLDVDRGSFDIQPFRDDDGELTGVGIACCGPHAMLTLIDSLEFWLDTLADECRKSFMKAEAEAEDEEDDRD